MNICTTVVSTLYCTVRLLRVLDLGTTTKLTLNF